MFNLSPEKILVLGIFALVVLGPNRLPQAARTLGRLLAEMRRMSGSFQEEVRGALAEPHDVLSKAVGELGVPDIRSTLRSSVAEVVDPFKQPPAASNGAGAASTANAAGAASAASGLTPLPAADQPAPAVPDDPSLN